MRNFYFLHDATSLKRSSSKITKSIPILLLLASVFIIPNLFAQPGNQWEFYRTINLNPATPMADFQVKVKLNGTAQHAHMKSDGSDLRFYAGTVACDYWIEKFDPIGLSVIWVKIPTSGANVLTMYYGNPAAVAASNGANTFEFFEGFEGTLDNSKWAYANATQSGTTVTIANNGYISNKLPFLPINPNTSFFLEVKHKEPAYHRIRYYTSVEAGNWTNNETAKRPTFDYGYFSDNGRKNSPDARVFWGGGSTPNAFVQAGKNYLTQWQITDGNDYRWATIDYEPDTTITTKFTSPVVDKIRYINIVVNQDPTTSTIIDWIRVRKSDGSGSDLEATVSIEDSDFPLPEITSVGLGGCVGDLITITGKGFQSKFGLTVKIGSTPLINAVSNAAGTEINGIIDVGSSGNISITTIHGTVTSTNPFNVYLKPTVNVGDSLANICVDIKAAPLGGSVGGGATGGVWTASVPGGTFTPADSLNPVWTPPAGYSGKVVFTLTSVVETGSTCAAASASKTLTIHPAPPAGEMSWPDLTACKGTQIKLTALEGFANYTYKLNGVTWRSSLNNIDSLPKTAKTGDIVSIVATTIYGCSRTFTSDPLVINDIPVGNFFLGEVSGKTQNDGRICADDAVNFSFDNPNYTSYQYTLVGESAVLSTESGFTASGLTNGAQVQLVINNDGCIKEFFSNVITVDPLPVPTLGANKSSICLGEPVTFTAGGGATYQFFLNDTDPLGSVNPLVTNILENGNEVSVIVTDANKCSAKTTASPITVFDLPGKPEITPAGPLSFCVGTTPVTLTTGLATSYQWYKDGVALSGATSQTYTTANTVSGGSGTYTVVVTNTNGCLSPHSDGVDVVVHPSAAKPTTSVTGTLEFCEGGSVTLTSSNATSYQWYYRPTAGNLVPIPGQTGQTITISAVDSTGDYAVGITNVNGCAGSALSSERMVTVNALPETPVITITTGDLELCVGENVTLSAPASTSYRWYKDGVIITGAGATGQNYTTVKTLLAAGEYTVEVKNAKNCWSARSEGKTVVVYPLPEPTIIGPATICLGTEGNEYSTEPEMSDYLWSATGGGTITYGAEPHIILVDWPTSGGVKTLNVQYKDANGCVSTEKATFTNSPAVKPTISGDKQVCVGSTEIVYTTEGGENSDYDWTISAGGNITEGLNTNSIKVSWTGEGPQTISVNYTNKDSCNAPSPTVYAVTVNPVPIAEFSYSATPYCSNSGSVSPTLGTGAKKGTFTFSPAGLVINSGSGAINTATSAAGTYTVTNTIAASGGCDVVVHSAEVTITELPTATLIYDGSPFCTSDNTLKPVLLVATGAFEGGAYSAPPGFSVDPITGSIDPSNSTKGSYKVTYTIPESAGCVQVVVTSPTIIITELPTVSLSYSASAFCLSDNGLKTPSLSGSTGAYSGGTYSVSPVSGLNINTTNGLFTPSGSTPGTYTVTYTTLEVAGCGAVSEETTVTITDVPSALIAYPASPYCQSLTEVKVVMEGHAAYEGGIFTSTSGLSINSTTGEINPSISTPGTYTIIYTIPASGGCAAVPADTTVTITAAPTVDAGNDLTFCADVTEIDIITGVAATNANGLLWTTSGDGTFSNANSIANNKYSPGPTDKASGSVTLTLTVYGVDNCASVSDTKVITLNALPAPVVIFPANAEFCEGTIQPLISVKNAVTPDDPVFSSGPVNVPIPDNNFTGIKNKITVSGIPANAIIKNISVKFDIDHLASKELIGNLRSPANKEINLFYMVGNGSNFTDTEISSQATNPIQTFGIAPFTGTYAPQGTIGAMGAAFSSHFYQLYSTPASLNGDWYLKLSDMVLMGNNTGVLKEWSITINYSIPLETVDVTWSPLTDLYEDAAAEIPYDGKALATVYTRVSESGTKTYTATNLPNSATCTNFSTVDIVVRKTPEVSIGTDYCSDPGRVILSANAIGGAPFSYKWNTGITGDTIHIDEARDYYVSATNSEGCIGTAVISIARELVINGDFEQGHIPGSFLTNYSYIAPPGNQFGVGSLQPPRTYAIDSNANKYHNNFFGKDHTTPAQTGNFMIVNGTSDNVIWEQTVSVEPNTRYYYSAWAVNLNRVGPFARLKFSVNGVQMGSIANLNTAPQPIKNNEVNVNNWVRFYYGLQDGTDESWYSGTATTATIQIINLEPETLGNDFGIDDISFATLSPFVRGPLVPGSDQQLGICSESPIQTITYQVGSGAVEPTITGLPDGVTTTFDGLNYKIVGNPVNNTNNPVQHDYELIIRGCLPQDPPNIMNGTISVNPNGSLKLISSPELQDQTLCIDLPMSAINYTSSGQISNVVQTGLPEGTGLTYNPGNHQVIVSGSPSAAGTYHYQVRTEGGSCAQDTLSGTIMISPESVAGTLSSPTICIGESGQIDLNTTDQIGEVVMWQISNDGLIFTDIPNSANTTSQDFTSVTQSTFYRVKVKNEYCPDTAVSLRAKLRISNLWEGTQDTAWHKFGNWSSDNLPSPIACSETVTIPQVAATNNDPSITAATGNAQVINLQILPGGKLTVEGGNLQVMGIISNQGILDAGKGGVEYNGTKATSIEPNIFLNNAIGDLKINNRNKGVVLNAPIDIYHSLTFGSGAQKLTTNDQLTLKSTKEQTAWLGNMTDKTITGKATVERFINTGTAAQGGHRKSWQLLATPTIGQTIQESWQEGAISTGREVQNPNPGYGTLLTTGFNNVPANGFDLYTSPGPSMKTYDPVIDGYDKGPVSTTQPIYNEKGYMVMVRGDRSVVTSTASANPTTLRTKGALRTGTQPVMNFAPNTWNSVGNPYASAIDLNNLTRNGGVEDIFGVWDPLLSGSYGLGGFTYITKDPDGQYVATPTSPSYPGSVTAYIQSGQAFMVQTAPALAGSIQFTESAKVPGSRMVMRPYRGSDRATQLRANLYGLQQDGSTFIADGIMLQFGEDFSNDIDGRDARKMSNTSENLSIRSNGKLLAIERRQPLQSVDTIFLNLSGVRAQNYRFEFKAAGMLSEGMQGYLEDLYLGSAIPLNIEGATMTDFNIENKPGSYASNRFRIVFKTPLAPLPVTIVDLKAGKTEDNILVQWKVENQVNVKEYQIEKSNDGIIFNVAGILEAKDEKEYNWLDKNVLTGFNYYRLRSINLNGEVGLSETVKVLIQDVPSDITIYPNPISNGVMNVHLINQPSGKYRIKLLNPVGQVMINKQITHFQGNSTEKIAWDYKMARGMYQLEVTRPDGGVKVIKVVY